MITKYKCSICGEIFLQKTNIKIHLVREHFQELVTSEFIMTNKLSKENRNKR